MDVRPATAADAEAIRDIYNLEVTTSTVTFDLVPRTVADQIAWLEQRSGTHAAVVATDGPTVVGFGSLSSYRDRPAYNTTVEDSVYVHRDHRGRGVGRLVLAELVDTARARGFHTVLGRIVGGHEASIGLHAALGFTLVGTEVEVGRKFGRWLDVVVMQLLLDGPPEPGGVPRTRPPVLGD
jgi:L-amino acid N-acyltransferase YncA